MSGENEQIVEALKTGKFLPSVHAARRMRQRSITEADIRRCGLTAKACYYQSRNKTWRIEGEDLDGDPLTVVCGVDGIVVIVTIF
jgi:hypothetical protein